MRALIRSFRYLKPYIWMALASLLALALSSAGNLIVPTLSQRIIDQGITAQRGDIIIQLSLAIVGIASLGALFTFAQGFFSARVSQGVAFDLRNLLYEKIQKLSFSYHDNAQTGQLLTRVTSDVDMVQGFLGMAVFQMLSAVLMLIGSIVLMLTTSPRTALVLLVMAPLALGVFTIFFTKARPLFTQGQERLAALNVTLQENLAGVRVIRAFVRRVFETERFNQRNQALRDIQIKVGRIMAFAMPLIFLIVNLATLGVTWVGGLQVIRDRMSLGELVAFTNYILMAIFPIFTLSFMLAMVAQAAVGAERIYEILDAPIDIVEQPGAQDLPTVQGRIAFDHVWFRYFEHQPWILQDVSFTAEPGQRIALLGATGSGKSTITNLIPRFYDVTQGQVTIDGQDIRQVTLASIRQQVGMVLQETQLFAGTIRENIAFGKPAAPDEEIVAAATAAQAHEFILSFPAGYDTVVGERGVTLSGGQKQRLAIARALLVDPRILILDDATSSVDFQTELKLRQALNVLMHGRTSFIIAQRVSTARDADLIIVLDKGKIAAMGKHTDLLENSALYADIYYSQLEQEDEGPGEFLRYDNDVVKEMSR